MKKIQLLSTVLLLMAALLTTAGCEPGNTDNGNASKEDSTRIADSLAAQIQADSLAAANARLDSVLIDSVEFDTEKIDSAKTDGSVGSKEEKKNPDPVVSTGRLDKCYFKVSFISIGSGIDYKAEKRLESEMAGFEKAEKVTLTYEKKNWGREGERDYCFSSQGLTDAQREKWATKIRKAFKGNDLVQIPK